MEMAIDWDNTVFFKTEKAVEELSLRNHGLRPKARQILVLLDGKRALSALAALISTADLHPLLIELKTSGFISEQPAAISPATPAPRTETEANIALDPVRLTRAKAYLIEISQQHLGLLASKLQREIAEANDNASLRNALAHWNMALRESRSGASVASPCLKKVHEILGHTS